MSSPAFDMEHLPAPETPKAKRKVVVQLPDVFGPFFKRSRYKGAWGGRGSTKSQTFARLLIIRSLNQPGLRWLCVREIQKSLDQSVKQLLVDTIKTLGVEDHFRVMRSEIVTAGGGLIVFVGMNDVTKDNVKSYEGFDGAWVEEAQTFSAASLELLRPTIRKKGSEIWFSWNPRSATDPVDAFLRGAEPPPNAIVIRANYTDNPWFPDVLKDDLEYDKRRDYERYEHVWEGAYEKNSEARIYKNWRVEEFQAPYDQEFLFGSDWGYASDPTILMRSFLIDRTLHIDWESYKVGCEIDDSPALFDLVGCTAAHCPVIDFLARKRGKHEEPPTCDAPGHGMARRWPIVGDSSRPETISYVKRHGYSRMEASIKGPNSVMEGIDFVKTYDIVVHPRCVHTIDELRNYKWKMDPQTGVILPIPVDKKNHVMDALRYAVEKTRRARLKGGLVW